MQTAASVRDDEEKREPGVRYRSDDEKERQVDGVIFHDDSRQVPGFINGSEFSVSSGGDFVLMTLYSPLTSGAFTDGVSQERVVGRFAMTPVGLVKLGESVRAALDFAGELLAKEHDAARALAEGAKGEQPG